jgi:hypothetical protein
MCIRGAEMYPRIAAAVGKIRKIIYQSQHLD